MSPANGFTHLNVYINVWRRNTTCIHRVSVLLNGSLYTLCGVFDSHLHFNINLSD